jgi:replicative DNA helicase
VDPLHVYADQIPGSGETIKERLDKAISDLKTLQVETDSVILVTSQKNRASKGSGDMGGFMGSAGIEYRADMGMVLLTQAERLAAGRGENKYRDMDLPEIEKDIGPQEARKRLLVINKQKDGETGTIPLVLHGETASFEEEASGL